MTSTRYSQIEMLFPSLKIFATRRLMELVWDDQQYTNWCFPLTVLPECLVWRALCCPKDIPKCRNQLLLLDNVPLPLKLSIHHSVWTCLDLSQKIKLYTFLHLRIDPTKDGIPQGLTWESYTVLCEVARWHQLPNFCTASEPFCYLPWKTWGCGGTHGFLWRGGVLQSIQMSKITLSAWHYHRDCMPSWLHFFTKVPLTHFFYCFTAILLNTFKKNQSYLISVYFFRPRRSDTNTLKEKKSVLIWKTPTPYKVKNKKTKWTK